jgi:hypothetical protein
MAAVAQNIDEEPTDPAEAAMSEAAFEVIQRAHTICGHPPAVDLTAELEQRAEQALSEARTMLQDVPDWKQAAQDAWHGESWAQAADEYQVKRGKQLAKGHR